MPAQLPLPDGHVDLDRREVIRGAVRERLTATEVALLEVLARHDGGVVGRDALGRAVWGTPHAPRGRPVDHAVKRLRRKLEADPARPAVLLTVRGTGYRLALDDLRDEASLFGRRGVLHRLEEALRPPGVLALTGPAGVGKSSIAAVIAAARGGLLVDLASSGADVATALAEALGIAVPADDDRRWQRIRLAVQRREVPLIVLDAADDHELPPPLCAVEAPVLWCSRRRPGEVPTVPLAGLATGPWVRLLEARSGVALDAEAATALAERFDGLPLAAELLARRIRHTPPTVLLAEAPLDAVGDALRRALDASCARLSPDEREVLGACAAFRAPFQGSDAASLCGRPIDDALEELIAASWLALDRGRLRMHAVPQDYVRRVDRQAGRWGAAHAAWVAGEARSRRIDALAGGAAAAWLREREADLLHVVRTDSGPARRDALLALCTQAALRGRSGVLEALDEAIAAEADPEPRADLVRCWAVIAGQRQWTRRAIEALDPALEACPPGVVRGRGLGQLSALLWRVGALERAEAVALEAQALLVDAATVEQGIAASQLASVYSARRDPRAEELHYRALALAERAGNREGALTLWNNIGGTCSARGDLDGARTAFREALSLAEADGLDRYVGTVLGNLAALEALCGNLDAVDGWATRATEALERAGDLDGAGWVLGIRGQSLLVQDRWGEGEVALRRSLARFGDSAEWEAPGMVRAWLALACAASGRHEEALDHQARATERLGPHPHRDVLVGCVQAMVAACSGEPARVPALPPGTSADVRALHALVARALERGTRAIGGCGSAPRTPETGRRLR
jgi:tetratricopeptide (TPR) repeat protein